MCNNCYCENYLKCSIAGSTPVGFCCPLCVYYDEEKQCLNNNFEVTIDEIGFSYTQYNNVEIMRKNQNFKLNKD